MHIPRLTSPSVEEIAAVSQATAQERAWYADAEPYASDWAVRRAERRGDLVRIEETSNFRPIMRLLTGATGRHALLSEPAANRLEAIAGLWRQSLDEQQIDLSGNLRLAVTSMVRTTKQQAELVSDGALAVDESVHTYGGAFDIDAAGYYWMNPSSGQAVSVPNPERPSVIAHSRLRSLKTVERAPHLYDARVTRLLVEAAQKIATTGITSAVVEFADTYNQCLHIAANPSTTAAMPLETHV